MNNAADCAKQLKSMLARAKETSFDAPVDPARPVDVLVHSYLLWDATLEQANKAYEALREAVVDKNELRVSLPYEIAQIIGKNYPRNLDRCERLRATLNDIYRHENEVSLDRLYDLGKRDVKAYLDGLDGIPPFVASRVALVCFDAHGVPVDDNLRRALIAEGAADESRDVSELANWLARQVKAADGVAAHVALQRASDKHVKARRRASSKRSRKSGGGKKTTRKKKTTSSRRKKSSSRKKA